MKKRGPLLAAFCIPLLITLIICVNREIYPFGDQCMLHIDMYHQYCPFFTELMEKLKTGGSPFYSWNIGLGADFVSLYAYYLASPLNWLLILWPRGYVIEFMTALSILKIALSGLTFTYYLGEHFLVWQDAGNAAAVIRTEKKTAVRLPADVASYAAAVCGAAYALCAFMAEYDSGDIVIDPKELLEANWYRYDDLPLLPPPGTVARRLIEDTVAMCRAEYE